MIKQVSLNIRQYFIRNEVGINPLTARFEINPKIGEAFLDRAILSLKCGFACEPQNPYRCLWQWPKNWWQHLKQDHAPKWFLDRFPVTYQSHEITVSVDTVYPHLKTKLDADQFGGRVTLLVQGTPVGSFDPNPCDPAKLERLETDPRYFLDIHKEKYKCPGCGRAIR